MFELVFYGVWFDSKKNNDCLNNLLLFIWGLLFDSLKKSVLVMKLWLRFEVVELHSSLPKIERWHQNQNQGENFEFNFLFVLFFFLKKIIIF